MKIFRKYQLGALQNLVWKFCVFKIDEVRMKDLNNFSVQIRVSKCFSIRISCLVYKISRMKQKNLTVKIFGPNG